MRQFQGSCLVRCMVILVIVLIVILLVNVGIGLAGGTRNIQVYANTNDVCFESGPNRSCGSGEWILNDSNSSGGYPIGIKSASGASYYLMCRVELQRNACLYSNRENCFTVPVKADRGQNIWFPNRGAEGASLRCYVVQ